MKISAYQTALLVALMFNRSGFKRARLTSKTLCVISGRTNLRSHFIVQLQAELDDLGLILFESDRGFGLIRYSLLNGAMVLSESSHIADELADIELDDDYDFSGVEEELGLNDLVEKPKKSSVNSLKRSLRPEQKQSARVSDLDDIDDFEDDEDGEEHEDGFDF
jgi:hypothetical protein